MGRGGLAQTTRPVLTICRPQRRALRQIVATAAAVEESGGMRRFLLRSIKVRYGPPVDFLPGWRWGTGVLAVRGWRG